MKSTTLSPAQRTIRARAAAFALHAQGGTNTRAALAARLEADERAVDPDGVLPIEERARRAQLYRRSRMLALALKASRARTKKAAPANVTPGAARSEVRRDRGERPTRAA